MVTFIMYPNCSTSKRAKQWLENHGISFKTRHIVHETPTVSELSIYLKKSNLPVKRFFNTSGQVYRTRGLKDTLPTMSDEAALKLLASNGMLIKRPLLIDEKTVLVGFNEKMYETHFEQQKEG